MTLIEVVVVIALLALISSVITAVVAIVIRIADPTTSRTLDATAERSLETWLAQDAVAVPPGGFDIAPATASGCAGAETGDNIVRMAWTEIVPSGSTSYVANYRYDAGTEAIRRVTCSASGANALGSPTVITIAEPIPSAPTVTLPTPSGVTVSFLTAGGESVVVSSLSRNPAQTLPTTTTSVAPPPPPCTLLTSDVPSPVPNEAGPGARPLEFDVTLTFGIAGTCGQLSVQYDRGDGPVQIEELTDNAPLYSVVFEGGDPGQLWTNGNKTITVLDGSTPLSPTSVMRVQ